MFGENITMNLEQQIHLGKSKVLEGHTQWVNSVFVKDNLIISGSFDKSIKIWDIDTGTCIKTLTGHINSLRSVFAKDNLIISGSYDNTIMISPITLYPGELEVFDSVIDSYWLPRHIEREIMDYFGTDK